MEYVITLLKILVCGEILTNPLLVSDHKDEEEWQVPITNKKGALGVAIW